MIPAKSASDKAGNAVDLSAMGYAKAPAADESPIVVTTASNEQERPADGDSAEQSDKATTVVSGDPAVPVASTEAVQPEAAPEVVPEPKSGPSADAVAVRLRVLELDAA